MVIIFNRGNNYNAEMLKTQQLHPKKKRLNVRRASFRLNEDLIIILS